MRCSSTCLLKITHINWAIYLVTNLTILVNRSLLRWRSRPRNICSNAFGIKQHFFFFGINIHRYLVLDQLIHITLFTLIQSIFSSLISHIVTSVIILIVIWKLSYKEAATFNLTNFFLLNCWRCVWNVWLWRSGDKATLFILGKTPFNFTVYFFCSDLIRSSIYRWIVIGRALDLIWCLSFWWVGILNILSSSVVVWDIRILFNSRVVRLDMRVIRVKAYVRLRSF